MTDHVIQRVLDLSPFNQINAENFPRSATLADILKNDARLRTCSRGDLITRQGDYGSSLYVVISGEVAVAQGLPETQLGRAHYKRKGVLGVLNQIFRNKNVPEVRDPQRYDSETFKISAGEYDPPGKAHARLENVSGVLEDFETFPIRAGELVGEIAALSRTPRTATIFAVEESELLEVRWQGLRDIRKRDVGFREHIDTLYRERSLATHLAESPIFRHLSKDSLAEIARETIFETHGDFDWFSTYNVKNNTEKTDVLGSEPIIAQEGHYAEGLILIRAGFGRVSRRANHGHETLDYLTRGATFGFDEILHHWKTGESLALQTSLRAVGYVDVLRVPSRQIEELVLPSFEDELPPKEEHYEKKHAGHTKSGHGKGPDTGGLERLVEGRYINGAATMLINTERCVGCDDCVRACSAAHDGNPRFIRHGHRVGAQMVVNACMHCMDPVCMIGCPTGAIHRNSAGGQVVINDDTCIGCQTCANSCPYENIRMVEVRDSSGAFILDASTRQPIVKATKCDLCWDQAVSPACERACPHDALKRVNMGDTEQVEEWFSR